MFWWFGGIIILFGPPCSVSACVLWLLQRQRLRVVAVSECLYSWADIDGRFWVYGRETAVYAPDYPQKHCWGCVILWPRPLTLDSCAWNSSEIFSQISCWADETYAAWFKWTISGGRSVEGLGSCLHQKPYKPANGIRFLRWIKVSIKHYNTIRWY